MSPVWLLFLCVALCHLTGMVRSGVKRYKTCPRLPLSRNLSLENFSGVWYHRASYEDNHGMFVLPARCVQSTYTYNPKHGGVDIVVKEILLSSPGNKYTTVKGIGIPHLSDKVARQWSVVLNVLGHKLHAQYYILGTDYTSYAVIGACITRTKNNKHKKVYAYILTRIQDLPHSKERANVEKKIGKLLDYYALDRNKFKNIDQGNCPPVTHIQPQA